MIARASLKDRSLQRTKRRSVASAELATYEILTPAARAASTLRQEIREGKYAIGQRMANERSLAERFGISRGTIRHALGILENERLIVREQGRGTFVADPTRPPTLGDTGTALIGALVWEKATFFGSVLQAATLQASERGYVLTTGSNITAEAELQHIKAFIRSGVRGVLLSPLWQFSGEGYKELRKNNIAVVMLDTALRDCDEDFVSVNDRDGTRLATSHLLEQGHSRLAYFGYDANPSNVPCHRERFWRVSRCVRCGRREGSAGVDHRTRRGSGKEFRPVAFRSENRKASDRICLLQRPWCGADHQHGQVDGDEGSGGYFGGGV